MSVVIETTLGTIIVDLYLSHRPRACLNFLKLCQIKYYNYNLFHTISRGFIAQTGDPTGSRGGGESIYGVLDGPEKRYFEAENEPRIKHTKMGLISFVGNEERMIGSQFFITLGDDLIYLDEKHCVFGEVVEGFDILEEINEVICDTDDRPYQDVRITHTVILDDPFPTPKRLIIPSRSPSPSAERLQGGRIAPDEDIDEHDGKSAQEIAEMQAEREAKARATILEMVGDIPDADMAPPENVLFVCKLNPVTSDDDLEVIFNRFGKIKSCEVIRDRKTGDSLQYAFIEFEERKSCEDAYFKMDNILIDDRRIHVDFSQSVSKVRWLGKGRGVQHLDSKGYNDKSIGRGEYKQRNISIRNSDTDRQSHSHSEYNRKKTSRSRSNSKYNEYRRSRSPYKRVNDRYSERNNEDRRENRSKSPNRNKKHGQYDRKTSTRHDNTQYLKRSDNKRYSEEDVQRRSRRDRSKDRFKTHDRWGRDEIIEKRNNDNKKKINYRSRYSSESEAEDSIKQGNSSKRRLVRKSKPNKESRRRQRSKSDSDIDSTKEKKRKSQRSSSSSSSESDNDRNSTSKKKKTMDSSNRKKSHQKKKYSSSDSD